MTPVRNSQRSRRGLMLVVVLAAAMASAGVNLGAAVVSASTPVISRITPASLAPGREPQMLTIAGRDFQPHLALMVTRPDGTSARYGDEVIQMLRESSFQVPVILATDGKYGFVAINADGGKSEAVMVEVKTVAKPPLPVIQQVTPVELTKGQEAQDLTVTGLNFGPALRAIVTDPQGVEVVSVVVRDVSPNSFKMSLLLETAGPYNLVVSNATGAVSNIVVFTVK